MSQLDSPPRVKRIVTTPPTPRRQRRNSKAVSICIVLACTLVGCVFFPLFVTLSFIVILNRKVRESLSSNQTSDLFILTAQLLACVPFYFAGPILLTICAGVQILFSAYHSAASEFLLISFCLPFLFTSPWWGSWWYVTYIPMSIAVPSSHLIWVRARNTFAPMWQKWSYEKGLRATVVTNCNSAKVHMDQMLDGSGRKFPVVRYIRKFLREQFAP